MARLCTVLVLAIFAVLHSATSQRIITNQDIKDSMLSIVNMVRAVEDKLERHEYRERQLGEHVKKGLLALDKRHRNLEPVKGILARMDERLSHVETILIQRDERERIQLQQTADAVEGVRQLVSTSQMPSSGPDSSNATDKISARLDQLESRIEKRLEELAIAAATPPGIDVRSIDDQALDRLVNEVQSLSEAVRALPSQGDASNATLEKLSAVADELLAKGRSGVQELVSRIGQAEDEGKKELAKTAGAVSQVLEQLGAGMAKGHEELKAEVQALSNVERVMLQTADNVMDTKRRIEYGVHQIIMEAGELAKHSSKELGEALNGRFDIIETSIVDNQNGALQNLTVKLETEMSQVWRQIGIMYQQLTASNTALDRLQAQTDAYVNGSLSTMDSMEGKVGKITSRMSEVDENLNYLLGRLSLITQEFNLIKTGLVGALDNIRSSFHAVQDRIQDGEEKKEEDKGPGPHQIPPNELTKTDEE